MSKVESVPGALPFIDDTLRCAVCGWPLAATREKGCWRGDCSQRPLPETYYSPERAREEYAAIGLTLKNVPAPKVESVPSAEQYYKEWRWNDTTDIAVTDPIYRYALKLGTI